jgi:hypothetical protein
MITCASAICPLKSLSVLLPRFVPDVQLSSSLLACCFSCCLALVDVDVVVLLLLTSVDSARGVLGARDDAQRPKPCIDCCKCAMQTAWMI